jgi:hypothetical protein
MYAKYERMRDAGLGAIGVTSAAILDGLDFVENLRMLRSVFGFDLVQVKEAYSQARFGESLAEHQEGLIPAVEEALVKMNKDQLQSREKLD